MRNIRVLESFAIKNGYFEYYPPEENPRDGQVLRQRRIVSFFTDDSKEYDKKRVHTYFNILRRLVDLQMFFSKSDKKVYKVMKDTDPDLLTDIFILYLNKEYLPHFKNI